MTSPALPTNPVMPPKKRITVWGISAKLIAGLFKAALLVLAIAILTPIVFFAWRAGQPMDLPEFGGRTYYQVLAERKTALYNKSLAYHEAHPAVRMSLNMCFAIETGITTLELFPATGAITLWYLIHTDEYYAAKNHIYDLAISSAGFFPTWWKNYELGLLSDYRYVDPVAYCNITPPTGP
jgi:hypothetical protein